MEDLNKGIIAILKNGFFIRGEHEENLVPWSGINRIYCYKHDYLTHDLICMVICAEDTHPLRITEEMAGYQNLLNAMWPLFPGAEQKYTQWKDSGTIDQGHFTIWKQI
ncbi:MAG: hypothetical protein AB7S78_01490 [Candidatus Omnitrophota bacterium]